MKLLQAEFMTFDDVLLVPQYSDVASRRDIDISTLIGHLKLDIPIISANMDSITHDKMALAMARGGGLGILHRYADANTIVSWIKNSVAEGFPVVPSVGVKDEDERSAKLYLDQGAEAVCIDVAHGHSKRAGNMTYRLKKMGFKTVISGNVATAEGAAYLSTMGADVIKVGIGPGSICTTRIMTGHGVPQLSAITHCVQARGVKCVIADGGIRNSGDIVKALAAGASAVMVGSLFAGCDAAARKDVYRGMASFDAQNDWLGRVNNDTPEGVTHHIDPSRQNVKLEDILKSLCGGIRSGLSYSGSRNLEEFKKNAVFCKVSHSTLAESGTRK